MLCYQNALLVEGDASYEGYRKLGNLYASIGMLEDAVFCLDNAINLATDVTEKANSIAEKAVLLTCMDDKLREAVDLFLTAIKMNNMNLDLYYPLVLTYKELNISSISEWKLLIKKMETAIEQQVRGKSILIVSEKKHSTSHDVGRKIYWALFEAYEVVGEYRQAWRYLEKAQKSVIDYQSRNYQFTERTTVDFIGSEEVLLHHILTSVYPTGLRKQKREEIEFRAKVLDPIFLIGMPRLHSY